MPAVLREINNFIFISSTQQKQQTTNNPAKKYANGQSLDFDKSVRHTRFLGGEDSHTSAKICFLKAKMPDTNTQFIQLKNDSTLELKGLTRCKWRTVLILVYSFAKENTNLTGTFVYELLLNTRAVLFSTRPFILNFYQRLSLFPQAPSYL